MIFGILCSCQRTLLCSIRFDLLALKAGERLFELKNPMGWVKNKDISIRLNVKAPSVTNMLQKLAKAELIQWTPRKGIKLTDSGKERAKQIVTSHVIMELFLNRVLGMEISLAGASFLTTEKLGAFQYGSNVVNLTADLAVRGIRGRQNG